MDSSVGSSFDATLLVVVASYALFVVACGIVGVRLIALATRTRQFPEFLLGFGLCCMVIAMPILGVSGVGRGTAGDFNSTMGAAAFFLIWVGIVSMTAFTWRTFRAESNWAAFLVQMIAVMEAFVCLGSFHAISSADPSSPAFDATSGWILWLRFPVSVMFFWTGLEGFLLQAPIPSRFCDAEAMEPGLC